MYIHCVNINKSVREMADKLKLGASYTSNLISVWQSQNNSTEYPSIDELKSLLTEQERLNNEIGLAIPEYTMEKFDPNKPLARTSKDNKIILMELPEENPLGYFFDYINGGKNNTSDQKKEVFEELEKAGFKQEELSGLITTPEEAYNFLLWHEMSHVQYNDREVYHKNGDDLTTPDKIAIEVRATKDAWLKARVYRHKHPIDKQQMQQQPQQQNSFDVSKAEFYSGAANGSDKEWGSQARALGIKVKDYTVQDWDALPQEWKDRLEKQYQEVVKVIGRKVLDKTSYSGKLVRRDMMQADKADAIFAVGTISSAGIVNGGTAYAATRGILRGIPVYIFDQSDNQWKVWDKNSNTFVTTSEPTLTPHAATIGTREINDAGKQAIKSILTKTVSQQTVQQNIPAFYSEDGKTPITIYRGYALKEDREASTLEETIGHTAVDYDDTLKGAIYFTSSKEEAEDYAKGRTDKSPEPPTQENPQGRPINRHYTGDYAKVSKYHIAANAKVEHYANMKDYVKNGKNSTADVIVLDKGTLWADNTEYIVRNPSVVIQQTVQQQSIPASYEGKVNNNMNNNTNVNNVTKVPEIGTEVIDTNKENPRTKLAKDYNSVTRQDRVIMLARMFSKKVDAIVKEKSKEVAREMADELSKSNPSRDEIMRINARAMLFNDGIKGRRAAMEDATIKKIFESMREDIEDMASTSVEDFEEEYGEGTGEHMVAEYNKILDNWYALLDEACIYIEKAENVRVTVEEAKEDNKEVQGKTSDSTQDEDTNDAANNDDEDGERVEGNVGWNFKVRFVDPRTSLSKDVKKILNSIVRFNSNGEIDVDDLGNTRYLDSEVAHAALINHLSNMIDADDFCVKDENGNYTLPALQKVAVRYPWVNQVINALKHNPSAISAFYADFRKDFIPYWTQIFDKEKQVWKTVALNSPVALDSVMSEVTQNYEHGDTLEEDSLYTKSGKVNPKAASTGLEEVNNALSDIRDYDSEDDTEMVDTIVKNLRRIGFNTNKTVIGNLLNTENGINDVESVLHRVKRIYQESVNLDADAHLISSLNDDYSEIAKIIGLVSELNNVQSFREGDKTYYSYSAPNYIDTLVKTIKNDARRNSYIEKEFGFTEWFRNSDGKWMSEWVNLLLNDEDVRFQFDTKELLSIDGTQYTDWKPWQIKKAFILEYFSLGTNKGSNKQYAWYNIPILSDSPVAKFIKFKRYTGKFVEQLLPLFRNVVKQELWRIQLVQDRAAVGASPIGNFDDVGTKFHFFPELNANNNEFLKNVTELKKACKKTGDASAMDDYIDRTILSIMNANFEVFLETNLSDENKNEIANTLIADGTIKNADGLNAALEEYFWNQAYATTQIIELTTTDLAFYKDGTDFQKRYKEVYAAGTKLNTNSPYGRKVERTIYLTDDEITSNSYLDIKKSLDDAVKLGHITASERDNILSKFKEVNVADAQAYRSISSMRAVLDMMGAWDDNMQKSYDRITNGKWEPQDFNIVWQTIKPFVFTQIHKPDGLGGEMKVSHQNKNSEFLLLALHNVIASSLSKSPKLRAINRFMEKHDIDVIQFESAVKAGKQGRVNINYSKDKLNTWAGQNVAAYNEIESAVTSLGKDLSKMSMYEIFKLGNDTLLDQNKLSQEEYNNRFNSIQPDEEEVYKTLEKCALQENGEYNPTVVHELPYSDYSIQQPTPEHLFDVEAVFGSQFRNLILSDIPEDAIIKVNGKDMTKKEVVYLYHSIVVENLLEDYKEVAGKFSSIESLQKALLDSVKGNPKYGRDMLDALQLVEITDPRDSNKTIKVFNIPLDNPNTTTKIQELVTSMFKNAVTKQHIKGGACILVSSYGHNDPPQVLHNEDGSIKGIECYLPAYSKQFYAPFMVTKHTEKGKEYQELDINKMPLELRRLVGYRIPTEDKYSMAPLIVKGFLPQQNGSAIMLPADITQIAGSDFDVRLLLMSK